MTHTTKTAEDPAQQCELVGKKVMLRHPRFRAKWTVQDSGSEGAGGWAVEGLERYQVLLGYANQGRANARCLDVEQAVLASLREDNQVTASSWADHRGDRRLRRRRSGPVDYGPDLLNGVVLDNDSGDEA